MTAISNRVAQSGLSQRGSRNAQEIQGKLEKMMEVIQHQWTPENPSGIVILGIADNSLMRNELVEYFNTPGRLQLEARDLTYADRIFASARTVDAVRRLFNEVPDGFYGDYQLKEEWTPPLKKVEREHLIIGSGATGILDATFWALANKGDGILVSVPYYNAFDLDLTTRCECKIVPVHVPVPEASSKDPKEPTDSFAEDTIKNYQAAHDDARSKGIAVKAILVCNPHNPTGAIYPRKTIIALARFAADNDLHLVMDEIYARSVFRTKAIERPTPFHSILGIDVKKEAGLDPSRVHVITSASKDFSINGFRLGLFISQHNKDVINAMLATAITSQTASPAALLWSALLNDEKYLDWYLAENRKRLSAAFDYLASFLSKHDIPYVPSNAGHFLLVDMRRFLTVDLSKANEDEAREAEGRLVKKFIEGKVFLAPGAQYHHPVPGFVRLTFSVDPTVLKIGLARVEKVLGLEAWIDKQPGPQYGSINAGR